MSTIFLWLNMVVAAVISTLVFGSGPRGKQGWKNLRQSPWFWQFLFAGFVLVLNLSPYHLIWTALLSFVIAYRVRYSPAEQNRRRLETDSKLTALLARLPEEIRDGCAQFLTEFPEVRESVASVSVEQQISANVLWDLSVTLCVVGKLLFRNGKKVGGLTAFRLAVAIDPNNPLCWENLAESHLALTNLAARKWANKVLLWKPSTEMAYKGWQLYTSPEGIASLTAMKARMQGIVSTCDAHPEWLDSTNWLSSQ